LTLPSSTLLQIGSNQPLQVTGCVDLQGAIEVTTDGSLASVGRIPIVTNFTNSCSRINVSSVKVILQSGNECEEANGYLDQSPLTLAVVVQFMDVCDGTTIQHSFIWIAAALLLF